MAKSNPGSHNLYLANKIRTGCKDSEVRFMNMKCFLDVAYLRKYFGGVVAYWCKKRSRGFQPSISHVGISKSCDSQHPYQVHLQEHGVSARFYKSQCFQSSMFINYIVENLMSLMKEFSECRQSW